jgi:glycosyl transferase family 2
MTVHNGAPHVADAIRSIQAQSYSRWELVVIDNGSDDDSAAVVEGLAGNDRRIRLITGFPCGPRARAINAGVDLARGQLIARMDADDVAVPGRLAMQVEWMRRTSVEICGGWIQRFGDRDGLAWFPETHDAIARELLFRCALMQPTVLMHAEILKRHRYSDRVNFEDYELWTRLVGRYRMGNVPAVLLRYRCHPEQSHIVEAPAFEADRRRLRARMFDALFPDATRRDAELIDRVADGMSFASTEELAHAGSLLVALAQSPDTMLRRRMLERWRGSCRRSTHLGLGAWRSYQRLATQFGIPSVDHDRRLRAACALRVGCDSRVVRGVVGMQRASRQRWHAAA